MWRGFSTSFSMYTSPQENAAAASACACASSGCSASSVRTTRMPRPPPPAEALSITGYPISRRDLQRFLDGFQNALRAGQNRHAGFFHGRASHLLQAHQADHVRRGADELQAAGFANFGEVGVFGQEAIAGMNRVGVADFGGADDAGNVQIAARALGRADADRPHRRSGRAGCAGPPPNTRRRCGCPDPCTRR